MATQKVSQRERERRVSQSQAARGVDDDDLSVDAGIQAALDSTDVAEISQKQLDEIDEALAVVNLDELFAEPFTVAYRAYVEEEITDEADATGVLAAQGGARTVSVKVRNVGVARAVGAEALLAHGARWLAFTDADTLVSASWLVDQLALDADAVCGSVGIEDWSPHGVHADLLRAHFLETYSDRDGHRHVHGANLGVSAAAYRRAGGFKHLACSEDVAFVAALEATGARIAWSAVPRVVTSARRDARAVGGFADALLSAVATRLSLAPELCVSAGAA